MNNMPPLDEVIRLAEDNLIKELESDSWQNTDRTDIIRVLVKSYVLLNQAYRGENMYPKPTVIHKQFDSIDAYKEWLENEP